MPDPAPVLPIRISDIDDGEQRIDSHDPKNLVLKQIVWDGTATESAPIYKLGGDIVGIQWAANSGDTFTFSVSIDGSTWTTLTSVAAEDISSAGSKGYSDLSEWPWFKVVASSAPAAGSWRATIR